MSKLLLIDSDFKVAKSFKINNFCFIAIRNIVKSILIWNQSVYIQGTWSLSLRVALNRYMSHSSLKKWKETEKNLGLYETAK